MSPAVEEILARVLRDRAFADLLLANPQAALAEYELSDDERAAIVRACAEKPSSAPLQDRPNIAGRLV